MRQRLIVTNYGLTVSRKNVASSCQSDGAY